MSQGKTCLLFQPLEWLSPSGELVGKRSSNRRVNAGHRANETHLLGLFIANATLGDSGNWTCRSGDELNETITIYVAGKYKTRCNRIPALLLSVAADSSQRLIFHITLYSYM